MSLFTQIAEMVRTTVLTEFSVKPARCPLCGLSIFVKTRKDRWGIRCIKCGASSNSISIVNYLNKTENDWRDKSLYIMSSTGPLFRYIRNNCSNLTNSVYHYSATNGSFVNGVMSQDVQNLTFDDNTFDFIISAEVFEHDPDDRKGFSEIFRVLRPGGRFVFTVPLDFAQKTIERAYVVNGGIFHLLPPKYHNDSVRSNSVLCFRDYGYDITARLEEAGFPNVDLSSNDFTVGWKVCSPTVAARKPKGSLGTSH